MDAGELFAMVAHLYEGAPDSCALSLGHWVDDGVLGPPHKVFSATIRLTLKEVREMARLARKPVVFDVPAPAREGSGSGVGNGSVSGVFRMDLGASLDSDLTVRLDLAATDVLAAYAQRRAATGFGGYDNLDHNDGLVRIGPDGMVYLSVACPAGAAPSPVASVYGAAASAWFATCDTDQLSIETAYELIEQYARMFEEQAARLRRLKASFASPTPVAAE